MPLLDTPELNRRFLAALGDRVLQVDDVNASVLTLEAGEPLPRRLRVYLFNATNPPGGRSTPEHKIQLMVPGQRRHERGNFDRTDDRRVLMVGYAQEYDVFVLWDADLHRDFAFSKNAQIRTETVRAASESGAMSTQTRRLQLGTETVIAAPASLLADAIVERLAGIEGRRVPQTAITVTGRAEPQAGGQDYVPPSRAETPPAPAARVFEVDPDAIDRGTKAHKDLQDGLAEALRSRGLRPLSPLPGDPQFDIAWRHEGVAFIGEVKSLTDGNEERQLRLGLGQVLSYVHVLAWPDVEDVRGVLVVERKPTADYWTTLCAEHDVVLTWPEAFDDLFQDPG